SCPPPAAGRGRRTRARRRGRVACRTGGHPTGRRRAGPRTPRTPETSAATPAWDRPGTPGSATSSPRRTHGSCPARRPGRTARRSGRPRSCSPSVGSLLQELSERRLVEDRRTELLRLRELRTGILAHDHVARLLRHAARDLAAPRFDRGLGFLTGERLEPAGEHE